LNTKKIIRRYVDCNRASILVNAVYVLHNDESTNYLPHKNCVIRLASTIIEYPKYIADYIYQSSKIALLKLRENGPHSSNKQAPLFPDFYFISQAWNNGRQYR